jgi:hypothetical protein
MQTSFKIRIMAIVVLIWLVPAQVLAQGRLGFGFVFGDPTGIAWKYRISNVNAIDGAVGFSPVDRFRMHIDYLWQSYPFAEQNLALHYGLGTAIGFGRTEYFVFDRGSYIVARRELGFGARAVVGLTYVIPKSPLDVFLEVAPVFILSPDPPGMGFDVGLGARIYP